jgi:hypothetical protein
MASKIEIITENIIRIKEKGFFDKDESIIYIKVEKIAILSAKDHSPNNVGYSFTIYIDEESAFYLYYDNEREYNDDFQKLITLIDKSTKR